MKKCYATLLLAALCSTATLAQQQDSLITQPAPGETINLYRTTTGYESVYYYAVDHQSTGDWQRMVFGEDGAVYLENPSTPSIRRPGSRVIARRVTPLPSSFPRPSSPRRTSSLVIHATDTWSACAQESETASRRSFPTRIPPTRCSSMYGMAIHSRWCSPRAS